MADVYRINVYVPITHVEEVKQALFNAGAGQVGLYDQCCWQTQGQGQFRPLKGSNAFIGDENKLQSICEVKLELVCVKEVIKSAVTAMLHAHPYEEVAFDVYQTLDLSSL